MLFRVAAGVAIAAGLVFVVAVIFFSGVMVGRAWSGNGDDGRVMAPSCPMMSGDGMMPGGMMPGGMMRPSGMPRPTPIPIPTAPGGARP